MLFSRSTIVSSALAAAAIISPAACQTGSASATGSVQSLAGMNSTMAMSSMNSTAMNTMATPKGMVKTWVIQVSDTDGNKRFSPEDVKASPGDMIQFHFYPMKHSVAQSSFANPCQPLPANGSAPAGFWSGFMPVTAQDSVMPVYTIMVNDTKPIWFYCATEMHCEQGMAGVINAPAGKTLAMYKSAAQTAKTVVPSIIEGGVAGTNATNSTSLTDNPSTDIGTGSSSGNATGGSATSGSGSGAPASSSSAPGTQPTGGAVRSRPVGLVMALVGVAVAAVLVG